MHANLKLFVVIVARIAGFGWFSLQDLAGFHCSIWQLPRAIPVIARPVPKTHPKKSQC